MTGAPPPWQFLVRAAAIITGLTLLLVVDVHGVAFYVAWSLIGLALLSEAARRWCTATGPVAAGERPQARPLRSARMNPGAGFNRRALLGAAAGGAAAAVIGPASSQAASSGAGLLVPRQNIGIQLYTVRGLADADLPGVLALVASIGYAEVELDGLRGRTPAELRGLLDANGLRAAGAHVPAGRFRTELSAVLDAAEQLGMPYVGVSNVTLPGDPSLDLRSYRRFAQEFNRWGAAAADRGLRFYFHNHGWDLTLQRGKALYDVLLEETDPDLVFFELDLYWMVNGFGRVRGRNPLRYLDGDFPQWRWPLLHVKDRSRGGDFANAGTGTIDFRRIFRALDNKHYHHFLVERDTIPDQARTARVGFAYLRDLGARGKERAR
jgi:sugar phosphate isomerase/epimerase